MTNEEIEALPVGREMDQLIAEKLFGHQVCTREQAIEMSNAALKAAELQRIIPYETWYAQDFYLAGEFAHLGLNALPHYSTDFSAAWTITEHLIGRGYHVDLYFVPERETWSACFSRRSDARDVVRSDSADKCAAICRAALKTIGA